MTTTTTSSTTPEQTQERVATLVAQLQVQYTQAEPTSYSRRALAELRRGVGRRVEECPDLMQYIADPLASEGPESDEPTPSERAALAALGLYALHQQSGSESMHQRGKSFGRACGTIKGPQEKEVPGVIRRFQALGTSETLDELTQHARGLVQLMRRTGVSFDYGKFARDLHLFLIPDRRDGVRMRWGRDFYRVTRPDNPALADVGPPGDAAESAIES